MADCSRCKGSGRARLRIPMRALKSCPSASRGTCQACQKLHDIDCRVDEARRALNQLLDERDTLQLSSLLNDHHDPLSHRLPLEISSRIMLFSLPFSPSLGIGQFDAKFDADAQFRAALDPSQVSRRWRTIAQSTPELWSVFSASISRNGRSRPLKWGPEWLKRSGNFPLYIELRFLLAKNHETETSLAQRLVEELCLHSARWKVIHLDVAYKCIPWFSSALATKKLTMLDDIRVSFTRSRSGKPSLEIDASPKKITTELHPNNISVDWANLRHFSASTFDARMSRVDFVNLLERSPNLLTCSFEGDGQSPSPHSVSSINHSLHTLKISSVPPNFWDTITLPSLKVLHLRPRRDSLSSPSSLHQFLVRSGGAVEDLLIMPGPNDSDAVDGLVLADTVKLLPHMQTLSVSSKVFDFLSLPATLEMNQNQGFLTLLTSVACHAEYVSPNWSNVLNSIKSGHYARLRVISFHFQQALVPKYYPRLISKDMLRAFLLLPRVRIHLRDSGGFDVMNDIRTHYGL